MVKEINIVYYGHPKKSLEYDGPEGKVWINNIRDKNIPNVFMGYESCKYPINNDNFIMLEPITVSLKDYDYFYLNKYSKIFSPFYKVFENTNIKHKIIPINYASNDRFILNKNINSCHITYLDFINNWNSHDNRINGAVIISADKFSNHKSSIYELRNFIGNILYKNKIIVSKYGTSRLPLPYFKGRTTDKLGEICKYKFNICTENIYDPLYSYNYLTEKLPHAIYGGAVPIYIGCYNVEDFVPEKAFIDLRKFIITKNNNKTIDEKELINYIKNFSKQQFEEYQHAAIQYMKDPKGIFYQTDPNRYYKKMLEIL
jgi:hypothetical protein